MKKPITPILITALTVITLFSFSLSTNGQAPCFNCTGNSATGDKTFASGSGNVVSGLRSFATGYNNKVTSSNSFAAGSSNTVGGPYAIALGYLNQSNNSASISLGYNNKSMGQNSILAGYKNSVSDSSDYSIGFGYNLSPLAKKSIAIGTGEYSRSLVNNIRNSLLIGFEAEPVMIVTNRQVKYGGIEQVPIEGLIDPLDPYKPGIVQTNAILPLPEAYTRREARVGIGTTTPSKSLQVVGNGVKVSFKDDDQAYNGTLMEILGTTKTHKLIISSVKSLNLTTWPVLTVGADGEVHVISMDKVKDNLGDHKATRNISTSGYWLSYSGGTTRGIYLSETDNVGINTSSPLERFQIGDQWVFHDGGSKIIGRNFTYNNNTSKRIKNGPSSQINFTETGDLMLETSPVGTAGSILNTTGLFKLHNNGNVSIGTNNHAGYKLAVNGTIGAKKLMIENNGIWPDYVFTTNYQLLNLQELENYITTHGHLPEIPTASQIETEGIDIAAINTLLLKKVEELTLYIIQQQKNFETQNTRLNKQEQLLEEQIQLITAQHQLIDKLIKEHN